MKNRLCKKAAVCIFILFSVVSAPADQAKNINDIESTSEEMTPLWVIDSVEFTSYPVVDDSGVCYISGEEGLYAINPDGTFKWQFPFWREGMTPMIGPNNTIYVGDQSGVFHAIDWNGNELWHYNLWHIDSDYDRITSPPAVDYDGSVYFTTGEDYIIALDPQGSLKWKFKVGWDYPERYNLKVECTPAIAKDGTIYFGAIDNYLYALTPYGTLKWRFKAEHSFTQGSPTIGAAGTIYIGCHDHRLYAVSPEGELEWTYGMDDPAYSSPTIDDEGTIYAGSYTSDGCGVHAIYPDGTQKWFFKTGSYASVSPVIGSDGVLYFGGGDQYIHAVNADGTSKWNYQTEKGVRSYGTMSDDGVLYFVTDKLYAFQTQSNGVQQQAQWPQFSYHHRCLATEPPELPELHVVEGTIPLSEDVSPEGIDVVVDGLTSVTDSTGHYSFLLPDGEYTLLFDVEDPVCPPEADVTVNGSDVVVAMPQNVHNVSGRFVHNGAPVSDVTVEINERTAVSDDNGAFELEAFDSDYAMKISCVDNYMDMSIQITVSGEDLSLGDIALSEIVFEYDYEYPYWDYPAVDLSCRVYSLEKNWLDDYDSLIAFDARGNIVQRTQLPESSMYFSIDPGGTLYIPTWDSLIAVDKNGTILWRYDVQELGFGASPAIGPDGVLYIGSINRVHAINPDGTMKWTYDVGGRISYTPVINSQGVIIVPCQDGYLYALDPDGSPRWSYGEGQRPFGPPSLGADGTVYIGSYDLHVYAVNPDGTLKWKYNTKNPHYYTPIIGENGTIYINDENRRLYAFSPDGEMYWRKESLFIHIIASDGTMLCGTGNGDIAVVTPDGDELWRYHYPDYSLDWPVIAPDGTLYINAELDPHNQKLLAIRTPFAGLSLESSWPCRLKDASHSGYMGIEQPNAVDDENQNEDGNDMPHALHLYSAVPNPFNPRAAITYSIPESGKVTLSVFNLAGQNVATLVDSRMSAGSHQAVFDGSGLSSGLYFYRLETEQGLLTGKMMLMK